MTSSGRGGSIHDRAKFLKVFKKFHNVTLRSGEREEEVLRGRWLRAAETMIPSKGFVGYRVTGPVPYVSGFHGYDPAEVLLDKIRKEWGPRYTVIPCRYRGARVAGFQNNMRVIVASEMYVPTDDELLRREFAWG